MTSSRVSVIVTNRNYGRYLEACLNSVFNQSHGDLEVIVVDDGSTDDSLAVLQRYPRVVVLHADGVGQAAALNAGFRACSGEVICLLDADDVWDRDKVAVVVDVLQRNPQVDWIRHNLRVTNEALKPLGTQVPDIRQAGAILASAWRAAERIVTAPTSALAFRRVLADSLFPLPTTLCMNGACVSMRWDADAILVARATASGARGWSSNVTLGSYRRHAHQQHVGKHDAQGLLDRQIAVGRAVAYAVSGSRPRNQPASVYKHMLVLSALQGQQWWSAGRLGNALRGWSAASAHALRDPWLFLRQSSALLIALAAPRLWLRRVCRAQGFSLQF